MKDLDRDAVSRSIDYRAKLEQAKENEFTAWEKFWIPMKGVLVIGGVIAFLGWIAWLFIRPFVR